MGNTQLDSVLSQSKGVLERITETYFNSRSIVSLVIALLAAFIVGKLVAAVLRSLARMLSRRADKAENLQSANKLRRWETIIVIIVALQKVVFTLIALWAWWSYIHPSPRPSALVGASAIIILILSATVSPILRDIAYGGVMMAEHWYGVGDYVKVEPFGDLRGIVERVTLRSTRIRGLNGEVVWISNQNIQGVRVLPRGVRTIAIDLFVSDLEAGLALVESVNMQLPISPLTVVKPLRVMSENKVGASLWHIVVISETAPGREWLLEEHALNVMKETDDENKRQILVAPPISRNADSEAERRFTRTVQNARKSTLKKKRLVLPEALLTDRPAVSRTKRKQRLAHDITPVSKRQSDDRPPRPRRIVQ